MSHAILNNDINNNEKTASSKLVGVKWCDIHKEWCIKVWELIQSNLIKQLKEIHLNEYPTLPTPPLPTPLPPKICFHISS